MKPAGLAMMLLVVLASGAGCITRDDHTGITVTTPDLTDLNPVNIGSFDVYTAEFDIRNPSNITYTNVDAQITLVPSATYCHSLSKTIAIPVFYPSGKQTERVSISEFRGLNCQYTYTYEVTADR